MAENVGEKVSELLIRVRDPQGSATSRTLTIDILSQCQRLVNMQTGLVTDSATMTLNGRKLFYNEMSTVLPEHARIIGVRYQGSNLERTTVAELRALDSSWFRRIANRPEAYAMIGREILVIHPGIEQADTVTVDYVKLLDNLTREDDSFELADQDVPDVLDLAEVIVLLKQRDVQLSLAALGQLAPRLTLKERDHG